jgi:hypothetical protein
MRHCLAGALILCFATSVGASDMNIRLAQNQAIAPAQRQTINMTELAVGDHWTYDVKDEISGATMPTRKMTVTDIANGQVATRYDFPQTGRSSVVLYDKSWNILRDGANRFSPNSGTGFQLPIKLDAQWKTSADEINSAGNSWKISVNGRVTGQESVTTKAGTFQAYVIETTQVVRNPKDPTANVVFSTRTWFNPDINHWVRVNTIRRQNGLIVSNNTAELIEYGRKTQ